MEEEKREFNYLACRYIITAVTIASGFSCNRIDSDSNQSRHFPLRFGIEDCLPFRNGTFYLGSLLFLVFFVLLRKIPYLMFDNLHKLIERAYRLNKRRDNRLTSTSRPIGRKTEF